MASGCWVRSSRTTVGRPKPARGSMWRISSSIGRTSKPPVRKANGVLGGAKPGERMEVVFAREVCAACPRRSDCTKSSTTGRVLHVRPQAAHEALQARRQEQETSAFRQAYQRRAGIEGTLSQRYAGWGYDVRAMMACTKRMCSMS